jgi:predicted O-methyltransferase YrrM
VSHLAQAYAVIPRDADFADEIVLLNMSNLTPAPVSAYLGALRKDPHPQLAVIDREGRAEGLPLVYPDTGALLHTLARASGARRILEIGTAIGYSTLWMATALPEDGALITMEYDASRAGRARDHFVAAGYASRISVIVGDATRFLHKVGGPFDLIFQDSDKKLYAPMLDRLIELVRPGGLLIADNILWNGEVIPGYVADKKYSEEDTAAIVSFSRRLSADPRLYTSFLQVGDGVSVSVKLT